MQANPAKFQGVLLKGDKYAFDFKVSIRGQDMDFSESNTVLRICIDENLTFDLHVNNICLKASRQIGALQRLTGLPGLPSSKTIYNSFIVSNFNYHPLVCVLRVGPVLPRFRNSRNVHLISSSRTQFLITKHYYQRVVSTHFLSLHGKRWQWKFTRF